MSILTGKHVLVVGEETEQISKVEAALITYGAEIATTTCEVIDTSKITADNTGLILINHLHNGVHCKDLLSSLRASEAVRKIPVCALVQPDQSHIAEVLLLGATDYFLPNEDVHTVIEKIKSTLGAESVHGDQSAIDISLPDSTATHGTRVFVVEDDALLQNLLSIRFEKSGFAFEMASNGDDLNEKIAAFKPQIVILDLMLPGVSGFDLLQGIKEQAEIARIPVLIFSNRDSQEDRQRAKSLGAAGFYVKAMTDLSELLDIIDEHKAE